jgi:hypothetical protein
MAMTITESLRLAMMSYHFLIAHLGAFLRLAVPWSILIALVAAYARVGPQFIDAIVLSVGRTFVSIVWCRAILVDEPLRSSGVFGHRERRFLLVSLIPNIVTLVVAVPFLTVFGRTAEAIRWNWIGTGSAIILIWLLPMASLLMALAAIAIDDRQLGIRQSIGRSMPIILPVFLGATTVCLPLFLTSVFPTAPLTSWRQPGAGRPLQDWIDFSATFAGSFGVALLSLVTDVTLAGFAAYLYRSTKSAESPASGA